jgi:hypothetical protein
MGYTTTEGIIDSHAALEQQLAWHLTYNHFPPVPTSMIPVCIEAIEAGHDEDWDRLISLPMGIGYKGLTVAPAIAIIESHHLDSWLNSDEDYEED